MGRTYKIRARSQKRVRIDKLMEDMLPELIAAKRLETENVYMT